MRITLLSRESIRPENSCNWRIRGPWGGGGGSQVSRQENMCPRACTLQTWVREENVIEGGLFYKLRFYNVFQKKTTNFTLYGGKFYFWNLSFSVCLSSFLSPPLTWQLRDWLLHAWHFRKNKNISSESEGRFPEPGAEIRAGKLKFRPVDIHRMISVIS